MTTILHRIVRLSVMGLALASSASAATPTFDQLLSLRTVSRARISPDGRFVAYEMSETDWKENAYVTQLWLADVQSGKSIQLTRGRKAADSVQWSPDGRWLAFVTEREVAPREEKKPDAESDAKADTKSDPRSETRSDAKPDPRQVWLISPLGGEAWALTRHGAKIESFRWSPDGKRIAFAAPVPQTKAEKDRKEKYSDYEVFEEDFDQNQLWVVDLPSDDTLPRDAKQITSDPKVNVDDIAWSPQASLISFTGTSNPMLASGGSADVYIADLNGNRVTRVVALPGPDSNAHFSPDGSQLAFNTSLGEQYFFYANDHIATVRVADVLKTPATRPADLSDVTASFDEDAGLIDWGPDGIYFRAQQKTSTHLFRLDPRTGTTTRVTGSDPFFLSDVSFTHDFSSMAFSAAGTDHLTEVYVSPASPGAARRKLTDMSGQISGYTLGTAEVVSWKSKDDATIEGILHKPANYDSARKYPLLVVIHGGPTGVSRPTLSPGNRYYPIEAFLAKGALVLEPNYRGSAGYGQRFRSLNVRNLGVGDMWDVMSGVDSLIAKGFVDPARLGAMGWSQGGYISAFLTTNTDRFKAISVGAGISNWTTYYVNTDITPFTPQYLHATPWEDPEIYALTSPMTNIRKAKTPTLIQHGERDKRVPPPNAYELYRGLRDAGVPARLIVYGGFGHGITKPKSNRAVLQHNYDWFTHYIWGDPIAKDSPLRGSGAVDEASTAQ
jgi:dipeptidyl aminopeptidase/acylaminoacyl peptidase